MDRCDGSLETLLLAEPLLPLHDALHIAERIACGLKYLHSDAGKGAPLKMVHGDLKPANVLLKNATREVVLTDFGLSSTIAVHTMSMGAKHLHMGQGAAGQAAGCTLQWAAPELLQAWEKGRDAPPTVAGDMYAFGVILYQLLVGKVPYVYKNALALKGAVMRGDRPSWAGWEQDRGGEAAADVLSELQDLAQRCWEQQAYGRPSVQQVHAQLVELKRRVSAGSAGSVSRAVRSTEPVSRGLRTVAESESAGKDGCTIC
jgi:serine/threonine protein kinase